MRGTAFRQCLNRVWDKFLVVARFTAVQSTKRSVEYEERQLHGFCAMMRFVAPHFVVTVSAYFRGYHYVLLLS